MHRFILYRSLAVDVTSDDHSLLYLREILVSLQHNLLQKYRYQSLNVVTAAEVSVSPLTFGPKLCFEEEPYWGN